MPAGMSVNTWPSNGWRSPRLVPVRLTLSSRCMLRSSSNLKVVCQTGGEMNVRVVKAFIVGLALIIAMPSLASAQSTSQKLFDQFRRETGQYHPTDPRHPTNRARVNRNRQQQLQQQKQRTRQRYRPPPAETGDPPACDGPEKARRVRPESGSEFLEETPRQQIWQYPFGPAKRYHHQPIPGERGWDNTTRQGHRGRRHRRYQDARSDAEETGPEKAEILSV
jgi:hypothetical protein